MSANWIRHFEIQIFDKDGKGISLTNLKVTFEIQKQPATIFNGFVGDFKIYNLSPTTQNILLGQEYTRIRVIAGYKGNPDEYGDYPDENIGLIFNGDIRFSIAGQDKITDSWVRLQCLDSWEGHMKAAVSTTIAAGWTFNDVFRVAMNSYAPYGITAGEVITFPDTVFPLAKTLHASTNEIINDLARQCDAHWWYEDNKVHIVKESKPIDNLVVLNADTGLIGRPQQTMGAGVNVRCLINPNIKLGGLIRLDQGSVYRTALTTEQIAKSPAHINTAEQDGNIYVEDLPGGVGSQPAAINTDGDYFVGSIDYTGDTRGQNWYMDLLCLAKNAKALESLSTIDLTTPIQ
ncbi:hypothetical protein SAMN05216522_113107 [Rosenbergiella nectarea]|uniref:Bacteriophage protein n=1 Tax=Rosenbergiella nectarea TaxID=988801 RepID=A0A1H9M5Q0_9GAMM|nr:hypothetical protein [Rosenbergiella nectarea]SER19080.1 hypothetical protein SAMN05216522_113107 [Rosenbergiella nectarea]